MKTINKKDIESILIYYSGGSLINVNRVWYSGSIPDCHSGDPGSIPGTRVNIFKPSSIYGVDRKILFSYQKNVRSIWQAFQVGFQGEGNDFIEQETGW